MSLEFYICAFSEIEILIAVIYLNDWHGVIRRGDRMATFRPFVILLLAIALS